MIGQIAHMKLLNGLNIIKNYILKNQKINYLFKELLTLSVGLLFKLKFANI